MAACTRVGPDYEAPPVEVAPAWDNYESELLSAEPFELVQWWQTFNDPVLNNLVELAYGQNLPLEVAGLRVLEARAQLGIAVGSLYPQQQTASGGANYLSRSETSANSGAGDLSYWQYDLGINVGWELDFWGKFRRGIESADAELMASIAAYDDAVVLLIAQVVDTYIVIRATEAQLGISRENAKLQKRSYDITETLFRNGEQSELDKQQALTLLLSTESTIPALQATLDQSRNALSVLLGQPPGRIRQLIGETAAIPATPEELAVGIPADLLRRRPDVRQAQLQAAAQSARIGVATADLYPSFVLAGTVGLVSSSGTANVGSGDGLFSSDSLQFAGGPAFSWNLFNYGRLKNNIRVQDARLQQALVNYENTVLNAAREVEDAITGFSRGEVQQEILQRAVAAAERSTEIALLRYQEGFSSYQRVLDAQQSLFAQQQRYINTLGSNARFVTALYRSLGGGWEVRGERGFIDSETIQTMNDRTDWGGLFDVKDVEEPDKAGKLAPSPDW